MQSLFKTQKINGTIWLVGLLSLLVVNSVIALIWKEPISLTKINIHNPLLKVISTFGFAFLCSLLINNICNRFELLDSRSNLPAAVCILLMFFIPNQLKSIEWMAVCVLTVFILNKLYKAYQKQFPERNYFDVALLTSLLSMIHLQFAVLILALVISIVILTLPKWHYFLLAFIGFILPYTLFLTGLFVFEKTALISVAMNSMIEKLTHLLETDFSNLLQIQPISLITLFVLATLFWASRNYKLTNQQKPILLIASIYFVISLIAGLLFTTNYSELISLLIIPLSIVTSFYFFYINKNLANLLFYFLLGIALVIPWIT